MVIKCVKRLWYRKEYMELLGVLFLVVRKMNLRNILGEMQNKRSLTF